MSRQYTKKISKYPPATWSDIREMNLKPQSCTTIWQPDDSSEEDKSQEGLGGDGPGSTPSDHQTRWAQHRCRWAQHRRRASPSPCVWQADLQWLAWRTRRTSVFWRHHSNTQMSDRQRGGGGLSMYCTITQQWKLMKCCCTKTSINLQRVTLGKTSQTQNNM